MATTVPKIRWPVQLAVQCAFDYPKGEISIRVPTHVLRTSRNWSLL